MTRSQSPEADDADQTKRVVRVMPAVEVSVADFFEAPPGRIRNIMFDARHDPAWMAAVKHVEKLTEELRPGARVRRIGTFLGRTLRWTTEVIRVSNQELELAIVDGPMRGTVTYRIEPHGTGSHVTIRNVGRAPRFAPRWLLSLAMRRSLSADLRRLKEAAEARL